MGKQRDPLPGPPPGIILFWRHVTRPNMGLSSSLAHSSEVDRRETLGTRLELSGGGGGVEGMNIFWKNTLLHYKKRNIRLTDTKISEIFSLPCISPVGAFVGILVSFKHFEHSLEINQYQ